VVAEEAADVRVVGDAEVSGHGLGVSPGISEQAPGFEEAAPSPLFDIHCLV
jgi:hypothetical protein